MLAKKHVLHIAVSTALLATTACSSGSEAFAAAAAPAPVVSGNCDPVSRRVGGCFQGASVNATGSQSAALHHSDAVWGECVTMVTHAPYYMGIGGDVTGTSVPNKSMFETKTVKRKPRPASAAETAAYYKKMGWSQEPQIIKREKITRQGETVIIDKKLEGHTAQGVGGPSKPAMVPQPSGNVYHRDGSHASHTQGHTYSQPSYGSAQPNVINPRSARRDLSAPAVRSAPTTYSAPQPTIQRKSAPATIAPPTLKKPTLSKPTLTKPTLSKPTLKAPTVAAPKVTTSTVKQVGDKAVKIAPAAPKIRKPLKLKLKAK